MLSQKQPEIANSLHFSYDNGISSIIRVNLTFRENPWLTIITGAWCKFSFMSKLKLLTTNSSICPHIFPNNNEEKNTFTAIEAK